ncbi:hypothetical protein AB1K56_01280 [Microbacterium sp. BWR-S6Y]|uniref:hypothetical protein n=1 Tax=Microbacterium sp. BWR-S6Y TaxID=3232073 RepID=UPI0035293DF7
MSHRELRKFTAESLAATADDWKSIAGEDEFQAELSTLFEWCEDHLEHRDGDAFALDLYDPDTNHTGAILEIVRTKRGVMTKLLKLYPSPEFWNADSDPVQRDALGRLYGDAFVSVIGDGIGLTDPSVIGSGTTEVDEIKIFGRTNAMYELLRSVVLFWSSSHTGWDAKMEGRWLALSRRK